jgi:hypothetical protein
VRVTHVQTHPEDLSLDYRKCLQLFHIKEYVYIQYSALNGRH